VPHGRNVDRSMARGDAAVGGNGKGTVTFLASGHERGQTSSNPPQRDTLERGNHETEGTPA
jgi:hypothetical protein